MTPALLHRSRLVTDGPDRAPASPLGEASGFTQLAGQAAAGTSSARAVSDHQWSKLRCCLSATTAGATV